jgi:predicted flap endonuclease-1-like 5' DNA nuclease
MKKEEPVTKRRRRSLPLVLIGLFLGAELAYVLAQRRRVLIPGSQFAPGPEGVSIYEVSGDVTRDWPAGSSDMFEADAAAPMADDLSEEVWGDVPAAIPVVGLDDGGAAGLEAGGGAGSGAAGESNAMGESDASGETGTEGHTGSGGAGGEREAGRGNRLEEIEGIGPVYAKTLAELGLLTTDDLLQAGAEAKGREALVEATGISKKLILRWVNQADLFRIKGVGEQYADLLEAAGVDTIPELAQRRADNLAKKMVEVNGQKNLVRRTPAESQVAAWIEQAKSLPRVVTY